MRGSCSLPFHTVAASATYGCSLRPLRLQPPPHICCRSPAERLHHVAGLASDVWPPPTPPPVGAAELTLTLALALALALALTLTLTLHPNPNPRNPNPTTLTLQL